MVKRPGSTQERAPSPVITRRKTLRSAAASTPAATAKKRRAQKVRARPDKGTAAVKRQHPRKLRTPGSAQTENKPPQVRESKRTSKLSLKLPDKLSALQLSSLCRKARPGRSRNRQQRKGQCPRQSHHQALSSQRK